MVPTLRRLTLLVACALLLGACELNPGNAAQNATATAGATKAGEPGLSLSGYPAPGTPTAIIAQPAPATAVAAPAPVLVVSASALVGTEWTILASGDLNSDKAADVVGIKLAQGVAPDATFKQPTYASYKGPASEVVIVQAGADGKPIVQAILAGGALNVDGATLASFAGAAGYMVSVTPGSRPLITIQAINAAGAPTGLPVGLEWIGAGYGLFGRGK